MCWREGLIARRKHGSLQAQDRREQEKYPGSKIPECHEHCHAVQLREARAFGGVRGRGIETADDQTQLVHLRRQKEMMAGPIQSHQKNRRGFGQRGRGQKTLRVAHGAERNERQYKEYLQNVKSFQKAEDQSAGAAAGREELKRLGGDDKGEEESSAHPQREREQIQAQRDAVDHGSEQCPIVVMLLRRDLRTCGEIPYKQKRLLLFLKQLQRID